MIGSNTITSSNIANGTITAADLDSSVSLGGSSPSITSIVYPGDDTAADPAGGQTITLQGEHYETGAQVLIGNTTVGVVTVSNSSTITFTSPTKPAGSYPLVVVNTDGAAGMSLPGIQYSNTPVWSTASGSLGTVYQNTSYTFNLNATSDSSLTFSLASGSLPPNTSLYANGLISGVLGSFESATTYNFTADVKDSENQNTTRSFSIFVDLYPFIANGGVITTVGNYKYHTFTSNGTFAITSGTKNCDILVVGGGGAGCGTDGNGSGGGGAGGYLAINAYSLGIGSHAIVVGLGGPAGSEAGANGSNSSFGTLFTALGGGGGGGRYPNEGGGTSQFGSNGRAGGSGGGGGFGHPGGAALQPTSTWGGHGNKGGDTTYVYSSSAGTPGGGGGGAGSAGTNAATTSPYSLPGNGGAGKQWLDGNWYAGGGGGGSEANVTQGTGGQGGGATAVYNTPGVAGTNGTGGGGSGTGVGGYNGGAGGSGIVIIRYLAT